MRSVQPLYRNRPDEQLLLRRHKDNQTDIKCPSVSLKDLFRFSSDLFEARMLKGSKELYEFGSFRLDVEEHTLTRSDGSKNGRLPEKAFQTLVIFVRNSGHLLTKQELIDQIWPDSFVEENNLDKCIHAIRHLLGEKPGEQKFIETVRKHGYRFVATVNKVETMNEGMASLLDSEFLEERRALEKSHTRGADNETKSIQAETGDTNLQTPATQGGFTRQIKRHKPLAAVVLIVLLAAVGLGIWYFTNFSANAKQIESIAVLPLENLSGDASQDYFADGMTDAVITELAKIGNLRVISRNSTMQYKDTRKKITEIASELNVDAVVVGTILRSGDKVRISTQMFRASDEKNIWSNSYERDIREVLALQSEVSRGIVSEIKVKLTPQEQAGLTSKSAIKPEANDAFFRGRYYFYQAINNAISRDEIKALHEKSFDYFQQAIAIEPNYAEAYAALAHSYNWLASAQIEPDKYFPRSIEAANKAIQIDETNALAHEALAFPLWNYNLNIPAAEKEYKRAIELDSNRGDGGYALLLSSLGRHDEAIRLMLIAERSDPLNLYIKYHIGATIYESARQYDKAIEQCRYVISLNPAHYDFQAGLVISLTNKGMYREAIAETQKLLKMTASEPGKSLHLAWVYAKAGQREKAIGILNEYKNQPEKSWELVKIAEIYAVLGEKEKAILLLEKSFSSRRPALLWIKVNPSFDKLRDDPRFQDLQVRVGLGLSN